ncbi:MAG: RluA family pseudouridine synthase [Dysgonamonadaceae bacterium]|jgi:23S rRNA pseudouridine1911/1915/1917 synthase|nr:RluA family pseudouridine synthase [Dysgonamonadaceae bacterium]
MNSYRNEFTEDANPLQSGLEIPENVEDELFEHFRFVADKGQNLLRVDKFLTTRLEHASRNRIQMAADAGYILANGNAVKSNYKVKPNDTISVVMDRPRREFEVIPENIPLNIVYEDDDVMVVNKPPGLVVHPGHGNYNGTLVNALAWYFKDNAAYDASDPRMGLVHRIDKDTSGLLLIAKNPDAKTYLGFQFYSKKAKRKYIALVWGNVKNDAGIIEENIGRHPRNKMLMTVFPDADEGKTAITHYRVLERFTYVTLVECRLETGRTHQIRVHMKYIGHPLFNDARYGGNEILKGTTHAKYKQFIQNCFDICPRQALHAQTLGFVHPQTGKEIFLQSDLPDDMAKLIEKWRKYTTNNEL